MKENIIVLDTETTGFTHNLPIEVAFMQIDDDLNSDYIYHRYFKNTVPIELGALATHHIHPDTLLTCELDSIEGKERLFYEITNNVIYMIGHNIDFDWRVLGEPSCKRICTLALSRHLFPELDSHTQSAMLYYFFGSQATSMVREAHSAAVDTKNCLVLFRSLLQVCQQRELLRLRKSDGTIWWEAIYQLSEAARVPLKLTFGKHKNKTYEEVAKTDPGYFHWWQTKSDTKPNEYEQKSIEQALRNRK